LQLTSIKRILTGLYILYDVRSNFAAIMRWCWFFNQNTLFVTPVGLYMYNRRSIYMKNILKRTKYRSPKFYIWLMYTPYKKTTSLVQTPFNNELISFSSSTKDFTYNLALLHILHCTKIYILDKVDKLNWIFNKTQYKFIKLFHKITATNIIVGEGMLRTMLKANNFLINSKER
jgi:hypothetical protein